MLMNISVLYYILLRSVYHIITKPVKNYLYIKISFDFSSVWIVTFSMCLTRHTACHCFEAKAIERMKCFTMFSIRVAVPVYSVSLQNQLHMCVPSCWEPLSSVHHCHQCHGEHSRVWHNWRVDSKLFEAKLLVKCRNCPQHIWSHIARKCVKKSDDEWGIPCEDPEWDWWQNSKQWRQPWPSCRANNYRPSVMIDALGGEGEGERGKDGGGLTGSR